MSRDQLAGVEQLTLAPFSSFSRDLQFLDGIYNYLPRINKLMSFTET